MNRRSYYLMAILFLFLATLACSLTPASSAPIGSCANPFLPTAIGATWNYDMTGSLNDVFTRTIQTANAAGFTDQDIYHDNAFTRTGKWKCDHGNLTRLDFSNGPTATVTTSIAGISSAAYQTSDSTGVTLPANISAGDTWSQTTKLEGSQIIRTKNVDSTSEVSMNCTAAGPESVVVPAGTFNAIRLDCSFSQTITVTVEDLPAIPTQLTFTTTNWYARNIGLVKSVTSGTNMDSTVLLANYSIP